MRIPVGWRVLCPPPGVEERSDTGAVVPFNKRAGQGGTLQRPGRPGRCSIQLVWPMGGGGTTQVLGGSSGRGELCGWAGWCLSWVCGVLEGVVGFLVHHLPLDLAHA